MLAILQPFIPDYREGFFQRIRQGINLDLFCYEKKVELLKENFAAAKVPVKQIAALKGGPFLAYNPFPLLQRKYDIIVLMLNFTHITTWLILLLKPFLKQKIILWGHGISVKRYVREEIKPNMLLRWMISLSDGVWFYTQKEMRQWQKVAPNIKAFSLDNTISDAEIILQQTPEGKQTLKEKYKIGQPRVVLYCARFNEPARRADVLIKLIEQSDSYKLAFIIIGEGRFKPDFSSYPNVFDFGSVYRREIKNELFALADIYFQPGWVGLSIVEAMAYGKPVFTFKRSAEILQCVEYSYIQQGFNGLIFEDLDGCLSAISSIPENEIQRMGENASRFVKEHLTLNAMAAKALDSLAIISSKTAYKSIVR